MTSKRLLQSFIRTTTIAAMIVFMGAGLAQAQSTWYVSSTEGDNNNDGSQMENAGAGVGAFASIGTALTAASDGDTIVVLAGAYVENVLLDESVTLQAVASGINTDVAVTGTLELDDVLGATITSGTGLFSFSGDVTLDAGTLTLATGELELADGVTVTVEDGTMAGASPAYAGDYSLVYDPTNVVDADVTAGTEFDGDTGAGTIQVDADYDNGTLTFGVDVITTTLDVDGDANVTLSGALTGDIDTDGAGTTTVTGDVTGNVATAAAGVVSIGGDLTGDVTHTGTGDLAVAGNISAVDVDVTSTGDFSVTGTLTTTDDIDIDAGTTEVTGATTANGIALDDVVATFGAVTLGANFDLAITNDPGDNEDVTIASLTLDGGILDADDGTTTITGALTLGDGVDGTTYVDMEAGALTVGSISSVIVTDGGDDDDLVDYVIDVAAGSLTLQGSITEATAVDGANEDAVRIEFVVADDALLVFEASATFSGDITNSTDGWVEDTEGIQIEAGTVNSAFAGAYTDLGSYGGDGIFEISAGTADIVSLEGGSNFVLSANRDMTLSDTDGAGTDADFQFTGDVTISGANVDVESPLTSDYDVSGTLTISGDAATFDSGAVAGETFDFGALVVTGDATIGSAGDDVITVVGSIDVTDTAFSGTLDAGGAVTIDGTSSVALQVDLESTLTVPAGATVTFSDVADDVSEVSGTTTVNGTLTVVNADTDGNADDDITFAAVSVGADGTVDLNDITVNVSGDVTGGTLTDWGVVTFTIGADGNTFSPGPNTDLEGFTANGSGRTLTVGQGFSTDGFTVGNDATVDLGDNTVTIKGDVTLTDEAAVTNDTNGALAFALGGAQSITVGGNPTTDPTLSNIRVNNASTVTLNSDIFLSGDLALNNGDFVVGGADVTLTMTGTDARITRDPGNGDLTVNGTLAGSWDVTYFGAGGSSTDEFADGQTVDVTVNMTDGQTLDLNDNGTASGNLYVQDGLVDVSADVEFEGNFTNHADLDDFQVTGSLIIGGNFTITESGDPDGDFSTDIADLTVAGSLTVPTDVVLGAAGDVVTLTGDGSSHSVEGHVAAGITVGTDISVTINGSTDADNADSGTFGVIDIDAGTVTMNDVQVTGDVTVDDGSLTINYVDGDGAATSGTITMDSAADDASSLTLAGSVDAATGIVVGNVSMAGNSTLTVSNDVDAPDVVLGTANDDVIALALGTSTLTVDGTSLDAAAMVDGSVTITGGTIAIKAGSDTEIDFNGNTIPALSNADDGSHLLSDLTVGSYTGADNGVLSLDDNAGAPQDLTITGDVTLGDEDGFTSGGDDGIVTVSGASTWTFDGDVNISNLVVDAAVTWAGDANAGVQIDAELTIGEDGTLALGDDTDLLMGTLFDYNSASADAISNPGMATVEFETTTFETGGNNVNIYARVYVNAVLSMDADAGGTFTVTGQLYLTDGADVQTDDGDADTDNNVFAYGDNLYVLVDEDGVLAMFEEDPTFGTAIGVDYRAAGATTTGNELPAVTRTFSRTGAGALETSVDHTTDYLHIDGEIDNSTNDVTVTLNSGGTYQVNDGAVVDEGLSLANDVTAYFDNITTTTPLWPATFVPATAHFDNNVVLHDDRTVGDLDVTDDVDTDANAAVLTITGNVTADATATWDTAEDEGVVLGGTTAQTLTSAGDTPQDLTINNAAGVSLGTDTDLDFASAGDGDGTLVLTAGVLTTNGNNVILSHGGTGAQGYTRTAGVVNGAVQKYVETGKANPNRVVFPTGDADGNYRPYSITFNDPAGDIGDLNTWNAVVGNADILLTATYSGASATGTNGLPIATTDAAGASLNVGRYPAFHWNVSSNPSVSPSVDYDVEFEAAGYANFASENIERTRAIRRAAGSANNFWSLVSPTAANNDNYVADVDNTNPVAVARGAVGAISTNGVLFTYGLEQNMVATAPDALTLNAGNAETIDLTTVFAGGEENPTYSVSDNDGAVASTAIDGTTLTVTGVAAGSVTFTVSANDGFQTVSTSVTATVNAALAAAGALADHVVALGTAAAAVDATVDFSGGTGTYTYAVATTDAAVAAVSNDAGSVTVTFGVAGTATVTVSATDEEGDSVSSSFDVTVNGSIVAAGGLAAVEVAEGASSTADVDGEFSGGNGAATYTYTAASSDADIATVTVSGSEVTVTGVSAYTVADGAVTADNAGATITVTATDDQGTAATSTYTVAVTAVLGNVDGSGGPSPAAASLTLDAFLGLVDLTAQQAAAADYNGDGAVTPFDAALIFNAFFNGKTEFDSNPLAEYFVADIARDGNVVTIPVMIGGDNGSVVSGHFATSIDPSLATVIGVTSDLGEGWLFNSVISEEGNITLAFASAGGVIQSEGGIASIAVELSSADVQLSISAEGAANNNPTMSIDDIEIVELPTEFTLNGNYPNPFNPSTSISFDLPQSADVEIQVIDMIGRQVMTMSPATISAGANRTVQIDASRLASGTYFYRVIARMESRTAIETGRMMLVK